MHNIRTVILNVGLSSGPEQQATDLKIQHSEQQ